MDSESDNSEYLPEEVEEKDQNTLSKVNLDQAEAIFDQFKKEEIQKIPEKSKNALEEAMNLAKLVNSKLKQSSQQATGKFAGETISFDLGKRPKSGLDQLLAEVKKPKNMSTLSKSTVDWEKFKKTTHLEESLEKNRKDGYLGKKNFLLASKEREKSQISSLKRKKLN